MDDFFLTLHYAGFDTAYASRIFDGKGGAVGSSKYARVNVARNRQGRT